MAPSARLIKTPLFLASEQGHTKVVDLLLEGGASVDKVGMLGPFGSAMLATPLYAASEEGHPKVVAASEMRRQC